MIKEERLKELIENSHNGNYNGVWFIKNNSVYRIGLDRAYMFIEDNYLKWTPIINKAVGNDFYNLINLYETKSEAEFYAKYGNVEKTVKMPVPPTWEEILKQEEFCIGDLSLLCGSANIVLSNSTNTELLLPTTKENYTKALDKMVELWREEV